MKILLCLFYFSTLSISDHNIQVAVFRIYQDSNAWIFRAEIDSDDLMSDMESPSTDLTNESVGKYLNDKLSLAFDGEYSLIKVQRIVQREDHTVIFSLLTVSDQDYHTLDIENRCLMNIEDQSNIIELRLFDEERDFLMNRDRSMIKIEL